MSLPLLPALRKKYPSVSISWVTGKIAAPLIQATGLVDHLHTIDESQLLTGSFCQQSKQVFSLWKRLFAFSYDLVITAHVDPRYRLLTLPIRKKQHHFFCRKKKRPSPVPGRNRSEEYINLALGEHCGNPSDFSFPHLSTSLPEHLRSVADKNPIALAPGGAKNLLREDALRRWPIENYAALIKQLNHKNIPVAITGAPADDWVLPHLSGVVFENLIGKTSLLDLVAFYQRCRLLVTHDSGPLHLAKLASCKTIALFGPTNPREFASPDNIVLWGGESLGCSPCYDGKNFAPCRNNRCMKNISPQEVLQKIESAFRTELTSIPCMQKLDLHFFSKPS